MENELKELKSVLRSIVVSSSVRVDVRSLLRDYRNMMGAPLPLAKYGYRDPLSFLKERCADCFLFSGTPSNPVLTLIVPDTLKHIDVFVQKQRLPSGVKSLGKRRSVPGHSGGKSSENDMEQKPQDLIYKTFNKNNSSKPSSRDNNYNCNDTSTQNGAKPEGKPPEKRSNEINIISNRMAGLPTDEASAADGTSPGAPSIITSDFKDSNSESSDKSHEILRKKLIWYNSSLNINKETCGDPNGNRECETTLSRRGSRHEDEEADSGRQSSSSKLSSKKAELEELQNEIYEIVKEHEDGIWCTDLLTLYRSRHGRALEPARAGRGSLAGVLRGLARVCVRSLPAGLRLHDAARAPPPAGLRLHDAAPTPPPAGLRLHDAARATPPAGLRLHDAAPTPPPAGLRLHDAARATPPAGLRLHDAAPTPPPAGLRLHDAAPAAPAPPRRAAPAALRGDALPGIQYDPAVFPAECMHYNDSIRPLGLGDVRVGAMLDVKVGEVYSPSHFWLMRLGESHDIAMEDMMDDMTEYYSRGAGRDLALPSAAVVVGHYCSSLFERDWHRSIIVALVDDDTVKVRHVDYGTVDTVRRAELKPLLRRWSELPAQAVRARLAGVRPARGSRGWLQAAAAHFLRLVRDLRLVANVVALDPEEETLEVFLVDTRGDDDVCLSRELVRAGHAEPRADSSLRTSELHLFPTFAALENGDTPNYAEIMRYLADGISPDYVEAYRRHVPAARLAAVPAARPPAVPPARPPLAPPAPSPPPPPEPLDRVPLPRRSPPPAPPPRAAPAPREPDPPDAPAGSPHESAPDPRPVPPHGSVPSPREPLSPPHGIVSPHRGHVPTPHRPFLPAHGNFPPPRGSAPPPHGNFPPPRGSAPPPHGSFLPPQGLVGPPHGTFLSPRGPVPPPHGFFMTAPGPLPPPEVFVPAPQWAGPAEPRLSAGEWEVYSLLAALDPQSAQFFLARRAAPGPGPGPGPGPAPPGFLLPPPH